MNPARCFGPAVVYGHNLWDPLYAFIVGPIMGASVVGIFQILVHQAHAAESGPVLPLNSFQTVTPDDRRAGFGPHGTFVYNSPVRDVTHLQAPDEDISHSQHLVTPPQPLLSNVSVTTPSVLQLPTTSEQGAINPVSLFIT